VHILIQTKPQLAFGNVISSTPDASNCYTHKIQYLQPCLFQQGKLRECGTGI